MDSNVETFGAWQGYARSGAIALVPTVAFAGATGVSFAGTTDAVNAVEAGLGQPQAMRTHKSITRPGSPPRGRLR